LEPDFDLRKKTSGSKNLRIHLIRYKDPIKLQKKTGEAYQIVHLEKLNVIFALVHEDEKILGKKFARLFKQLLYRSLGIQFEENF